MGYKRRTLLSLFLLSVIVANAVALPFLLFALIGGAGIGYWLGIQKASETEKLLEEVQSRLTNSTQQNIANMKVTMEEIRAKDVNLYALGSDAANYGKNYAWALAKYKYVKARMNGSSHTDALVEAQNAVYDYYVELVKNAVENQNATAEAIAYAMTQLFANGEDAYNYYVCYISGTTYRISDKPKTFTTTNGTINALGKSWTYKEIYNDNKVVTKLTRWVDPTATYYTRGTFISAITNIDSAYNEIADNLATFFDSVNANWESYNLTEEDLIDPYMLATFLNTDLNTTGYYGYAAAELALLGMPLTGLNKTIEVDFNGTKYEGMLFTDWNTTFERNQSYQVPSGTIVYIITDDGLYKINEGENFSIVNITDAKTGKQLQNTTTYRYVSHLGDATALLEELRDLKMLYEQYLEMQSTSGGGLSAWWNSLSDTAKLAVVAIGGVALYAILRRD